MMIDPLPSIENIFPLVFGQERQLAQSNSLESTIKNQLITSQVQSKYGGGCGSQ